MPIRKYKPTSAGRRFQTVQVFDEITATEPYKPLTEPLRKSGGRNNHGELTSWWRGGGKKPYKQKGTGRPQAGSTRSPLWRKGGTVFGPQPRSYEFDLPKKVRIGAVRAALAQKLSDGAVVIVDELQATEGKTKATAALLRRLGASGKTLVIDVTPADQFTLTARNIAGVKVVASARVTARDLMDTTRVVATRAAIETLQSHLA